MTDIQILDLIEEYINANNQLIEEHSKSIHELLDGEFDEDTSEQYAVLREHRGNFMQRKSVLEMIYEEICNNIDLELQDMEV